MELPNSITKRILWRYVNQKIKRSIHHYHVFSIITILFDEILNDLKNEKQLEIFNLGKLNLKKLPPRRYYDVNDRKVKISNPHKILRFALSNKLKNKLKNHLDIKSTFKDTNE